MGSVGGGLPQDTIVVFPGEVFKFCISDIGLHVDTFYFPILGLVIEKRCHCSPVWYIAAFYPHPDRIFSQPRSSTRADPLNGGRWGLVEELLFRNSSSLIRVLNPDLNKTTAPVRGAFDYNFCQGHGFYVADIDFCVPKVNIGVDGFPFFVPIYSKVPSLYGDPGSPSCPAAVGVKSSITGR